MILEEKTKVKDIFFLNEELGVLRIKPIVDLIFGKVTIEKNDKKAYVIHQNENLSVFLAEENNKVKPLAFAPDLICYMELDGHKIKQSLSNADIQQNTEVALIGFNANEKLLEDSLLKIFSEARAKLGDFYEYQPLENLNKSDKKSLDGILIEVSKKFDTANMKEFPLNPS